MTLFLLNPFPNKPWFLRVCITSLLKTLREKEKLLVTSNFSYSHSVFFPFGEHSAIFIKFEIVVCKLFHCGKSEILSFGKGLKYVFCHCHGRELRGNRRKCWLSAYFPFPKMFCQKSSTGS